MGPKKTFTLQPHWTTEKDEFTLTLTQLQTLKKILTDGVNGKPKKLQKSSARYFCSNGETLGYNSQGAQIPHRYTYQESNTKILSIIDKLINDILAAR